MFESESFTNEIESFEKFGEDIREFGKDIKNCRSLRINSFENIRRCEFKDSGISGKLITTDVMQQDSNKLPVIARNRKFIFSKQFL